MKIKVEVIARLELEGTEEISAMRDICNIALSRILEKKNGTLDNDVSKRDERNLNLIQGIMEQL